LKFKLISVAIALYLVSALSTNVSAVNVNVDVSSNGSGSTNSVNVSTNGFFKTVQSNFLSVVNRIFVNSSTGNNSSDGGSINTGSSSTSINVTTTGNSNYVNNPCCEGTQPVPEFGLITGGLAFLTSGGAFYFLRKRS